MARTWKDRVADGIVLYLRETLFTQPWSKRSERCLVIKLALEIAQHVRHLPPDGRIRVKVPLELAHQLRPEQLEKLKNGSWISLNELWARICLRTPHLAAQSVCMTIPQSALDQAAEILLQFVSPTVQHPLSIAHRVIEDLARHAVAPGWGGVRVNRRRPAQSVAYVATLQNVAHIAAKLVEGARTKKWTPGMAELIQRDGPPCLILSNDAIELPETFGIVGAVSVLPLPLQSGWPFVGRTLTNFQNFLTDILKKSDTTDPDGSEWSMGRRKELYTIRKSIFLLGRWVNANPNSPASQRLLELEAAEQKLMIAYWAFCRRTWEKLERQLILGRLRRDIYPSEYSVCGHNSFSGFVDDPAIAKNLGWMSETSLQGMGWKTDHGFKPGPADNLTGARPDIAEWMPSPAQALRERRSRQREDEATRSPPDVDPPLSERELDVLETYISDIYRYGNEQIPGVQAISDNIQEPEREFWRTLLWDHYDDIVHLLKGAPLFEDFMRKVIIGAGSPVEFFASHGANARMREDVLTKFAAARKRYSPEISRSDFEGMLGFDPVKTGFGDIDPAMLEQGDGDDE
jgi:hypothetical protein